MDIWRQVMLPTVGHQGHSRKSHSGLLLHGHGVAGNKWGWLYRGWGGRSTQARMSENNHGHHILCHRRYLPEHWLTTPFRHSTNMYLVPSAYQAQNLLSTLDICPWATETTPVPVELSFVRACACRSWNRTRFFALVVHSNKALASNSCLLCPLQYAHYTKRLSLWVCWVSLVDLRLWNILYFFFSFLLVMPLCPPPHPSTPRVLIFLPT